ncbi:ankyrin repeat domain-containing protein [Aspergillus lucknowensis]|uniref:Ankyrin repeat-containing domain protein n=1 Tax=Aspergillus lucknowensis TaxID=176173 RepID=A0ABR4M4Z5_9EURO
MEKGFEKAVELLISSGAQLDLRTEHGRAVLLFASERNWAGVREMIVERAADSGMEDASVALLIAANSNSPEIGRAIDRIRESPSDHEKHIMETAMFLSVELDHLSAVEAFLQAGVDVNSKDHIGQTALHRATRCESESMIRALIKYGAEIDMKNDDGKTPWRANLRHSNKDILDLLLTFGADPNTTNEGGVSELYSAAAGGDANMVKYLLGSRANPSIKTVFHWAPLHWAAHNDHIDCVALLIQAGADVNAVSDQAKTPLDMALGRGHDAIAELLVANGAKTQEDLQSTPDRTAHRPVQGPTLNPANKTPANTKVTLVFDQPLDEGYQWGQFIYIPEDADNTAQYRPYQISHRLSTVTDFISIRVAQVRVEMAEYPLPPEKFPRQDVLYDIVRMDVDYPELKLLANPDSPMKGDLIIRRTWTGNWQVHHEYEQGERRMLFRTIEANLDESCRWNDANGAFLATSGISSIRFESGLDRSMLDVLVSCWVAKLWLESLTRQEETTTKKV